MNIGLNLDRNWLRLFAVISTLLSYDLASRSIFDMVIIVQSEAYSSFVNHVSHSIADPSVVYPPATVTELISNMRSLHLVILKRTLQAFNVLLWLKPPIWIVRWALK